MKTTQLLTVKTPYLMQNLKINLLADDLEKTIDTQRYRFQIKNLYLGIMCIDLPSSLQS